MKIFNSLDEINNIDETVVALGNFDGVHKGHQQIIERTVKSAEAAGLKSAVFTFSNHTRTLLKNLPPVKNILYAEEKAKIIESMGVDYLFNIPFTQEILQMSPEAFIDEILDQEIQDKRSVLRIQLQFWIQGFGNSGSADA